MGGRRGYWLARGLAATCVLAASPCAAQTTDDEPYVDFKSLRAALLKTIDSGPVRTTKHRTVELDWGTGEFRLEGTRVRQGSKRLDDPGLEQRWQRGFTTRANIETAIADGWSAGFSGTASYVKRGATGGPLFTTSKTSHSYEAGFSLARDNVARFTLSTFDQGGWAAGDIQDLAQRVTSGDPRQKSGLALQVDALGGLTGSPLHLGLRAETSTSQGTGRAKSLSIMTNFAF